MCQGPNSGAAEKFFKERKMCQGPNSGAAEKFFKEHKKCQGTTSVVPLEPQNERGL
jgi:hypothetical protein